MYTKKGSLGSPNGPRETRTLALLHVKQVLLLLSYRTVVLFTDVDLKNVIVNLYLYNSFEHT